MLLQNVRGSSERTTMEGGSLTRAHLSMLMSTGGVDIIYFFTSVGYEMPFVAPRNVDHDPSPGFPVHLSSGPEKDHINIRILQTMISGLPLILALLSRM